MAYIYEHIRTKGYEPIHLEEHIAHLKATAVKHFGTMATVSQDVLRKSIKEALIDGNCSPRTMNAVVVRYTSDGEMEVEAQETLYNRFSLRALRPECYLRTLSGDTITDNTSAKDAIVEFHRSSHEGWAIWLNEAEEVIAIDGSSVIAVFEDEIRFSQRGQGVEFELAFEVLSTTKRKVSKGAIGVEDLYQAKELIVIGYEGVTAIYNYDGMLYMDIIAEKIASMIADVENF